MLGAMGCVIFPVLYIIAILLVLPLSSFKMFVFVIRLIIQQYITTLAVTIPHLTLPTQTLSHRITPVSQPPPARHSPSIWLGTMLFMTNITTIPHVALCITHIV